METIKIFTVNGTAAAGPRDPLQLPVQVAQALTGDPWQPFLDKLDGVDRASKFEWIPVEYPGDIWPMQASVDTGVENLCKAIEDTSGPFVFVAWSQGANVTATVWRDYLRDKDGDLHDHKDRIIGSVALGNPMRAPGVANGNDYAGQDRPSDGFDFFGLDKTNTEDAKAGGISGDNNLTEKQTPWWWLDFAKDNDLYTDAPVGSPAGEDMQLIYEVVMSRDFLESAEAVWDIVSEVFDMLQNPVEELAGVIEAIVNGLKFLFAGPDAGHFTYDIAPAIEFLRELPGKLEDRDEKKAS